MPRNSPRPNLIPYQFKPDNEKPFAKKQLQVRLPVDLQQELDRIPPKQRNQLVRQWISDGFSKYQASMSQESNLDREI